MKKLVSSVAFLSIICMGNFAFSEQNVAFDATNSIVWDNFNDVPASVPFEIRRLCRQRCKEISQDPGMINASGLKIIQVIPNQVREISFNQQSAMFGCKCFGNLYLVERSY